MSDAIHRNLSLNPFLGESEDCPSYQIIGDNVDLHQCTPYQTMERRDKDYHWFQLYAVRDCVIEKDLPNDAPIADVTTLPLQTFLPLVGECSQLNEEFRILNARVIVEKMDYFHALQPVVPQHIVHKYSDVMKLKSKVVSALFRIIHIHYMPSICL